MTTPLRNGEHGYGRVTKALHWITVLALAAQVVLGYVMDPDAGSDAAQERLDRLEERCETRSEEAAVERCEAEVDRREDRLDAREDEDSADVLPGLVSGDGFSDGLSLVEGHVLLGVLILVLAAGRVAWRAATPLPPWSPVLGPGERRLEALLEKVMLALLFVVPGTGLLLVADVGPLPGSVGVHVAAHVVLYATVALHVGLVLRHTVVRRERHLSRML